MHAQPATYLAAALATATIIAACGSAPTTQWLTDDLLTDNGRFYTTCEDSRDELNEKHVWLTAEQAADHAERQPCPDGELRTPPHREAPDAERQVIPVPRPAKPPAPHLPSAGAIIPIPAGTISAPSPTARTAPPLPKTTNPPPKTVPPVPTTPSSAPVARKPTTTRG